MPSQRKFVSDTAYLDAHPLPEDRPPTRQECWDYYSVYFRAVKSPEQIIRFARDQWAWMYVTWVNTRGWRKKPDWVPGEAAGSESVPEIFEAGHGTSFYRVVKEVLNASRA